MERAQYIQLSFFTPNSAELRAEALFQTVFDLHPNQTHSNRTPSPEAPFFSMAAGNIGDTELRVQVLHGRADFTLTGRSITGAEGVPLINTLEGIEFARRSFSKFDLPNSHINRLAVIVQLISMQATSNEVTKYLFERSGMEQSPDSFSDFIMQINRKEPLKCWSGHRMNRVITLNEAVFQRLDFPMGISNVFQKTIGASLSGAGTLLDFNTVPTHETIPESLLSSVISELLDEVTAFAKSEAPMLKLRYDHGS